MNDDLSSPNTGLVEAPHNRVLASLTPHDLSTIAPHLQPVRLELRQTLEAANRTIKHVYFIEQGLASVVAGAGGDPLKVEVGLIGAEGMTGSAVIFGRTRSPNETIVQFEGSAQRIAADDLRAAMARSGALTACLLRYVHCFGVQVAHSARANALGYVEGRLARWLLMARDRLEGNNLRVTHDLLTAVLGVRRAGVTSALNELDEEGLLRCKRGQITILNPEELKKRAGTLYGVPEAEFDRLFPRVSG